MKSNIDHSSDKEFSIGVPVRANLVSADIFLIAFAFCVLLFFMYCASSAIMYLNLKSYFCILLYLSSIIHMKLLLYHNLVLMQSDFFFLLVFHVLL